MKKKLFCLLLIITPDNLFGPPQEIAKEIAMETFRSDLDNGYQYVGNITNARRIPIPLNYTFRALLFSGPKPKYFLLNSLIDLDILIGRLSDSDRIELYGRDPNLVNPPEKH